MDAGGGSVGQAWRFDGLARSIDGELLVVDPDSRDWPKPFNARYDRARPRAVVSCGSDEDVAETVSFIRRHGLDSATRSGGHCFAGRSTTSGVLIDVSPMRSVSVSDGVVRVGAGARLGEVYLGVIPADITIPGGTCPSVGIAGLTLGGGLGFLGRRHGLTSDHLVGARIVLADGRTIECHEDRDGDLFLFCLKHAAVVDADASAAERAGAQTWLTDSWRAVHPWGTGGVFPNFPDPDLADRGRAYHGANLERLIETKARYDPGNVFRSARSSG